MRGLKATPKQFWAAIEAASRAAELHGSRFEDDTPAKRVRRMAEVIVRPATFNRTYFPHYFRDEGCAAHELMLLGLVWEKRLATRMPRGHGKTTSITFAYVAHQVACATVLHAWRDGTLATTDPALHASILEVMAEDCAAIAARGPLTVEALGIPAHYDLEVTHALNEWLRSVWERQLAAAPLVPLHWDPYIQVVGLTETAATEITAALRGELERNPLLRSDWGDLTPVMSGDWTRTVKRSASDSDWESNGTRVAAFGLSEGIRGGKHGPWRPSLAVFDDADGEESTQTANQRDRNYRKLAGAVGHGLEPGTGRVLVVGTPHHSDCLVCRLTEREELKGRWAALRFRARDEAGVILYPAKFTAEALDEEAAEPEIYGPELGDEPPATEARPFKTIHHYSRKDYEGQALPKVVCLDTSAARKATSDFQCIIAGRFLEDGRMLVHRAEFRRIADPLELIRWAQSVHQEEQPDEAAVEAIGVGNVHAALLSSEELDKGLFQGWIRIERQEHGKLLRVSSLGTPVNTARILLPDDKSCHQLELQLLRVGEAGAKMDGPDTLEMCWRRRPAARGGKVAVRHTPRERGPAFWDSTVDRDRPMKARKGERRERRMGGSW